MYTVPYVCTFDTTTMPLWKAILTDSHFWIPMGILLAGVALLVVLR